MRNYLIIKYLRTNKHLNAKYNICKMKLLLVFPPFAFPTYIPLASAQLKSYLEKNNPGLEVKIMDLNLEFHKHIFKDVIKIDSVDINSFSSIEVFNEEYDKNSRKFIDLLMRTHIEYDDMLGAFFTEGKMPPECMIAFANMIINESPDIVGFSTTLTTQWNSSCFFAEMIRQLKPETKIVFGGSSFATRAKDKFDSKFMDFLIYGEAELAFDALLKNLNNPGNLNTVPSLVYEKDGNITATEREEIDSIEDMPTPVFKGYNLKEYYNPEVVLPVYSSRSCAWKKCTYCIHYKTFHKYKTKSSQQFFEEIKAYNSLGIRYFNIVDEMILPEFMDKFCDLITQSGIQVFWHCTLKPMAGFDQTLMKKMHDAGCRLIFWGIESGNQGILDKMNKGVKVEQMATNLKASSEAKISNYCLIIIGFPGETEKELEDTCVFLKNNRKHINCVLPSPFFLYEESDIFENPNKYNITRIHDKEKLKRNYLYDIEKCKGLN